MSSPRIQPDFKVGERLTIVDSVGQESEAVVKEAAIRENALKIFVSYPGWSTRWSEVSYSVVVPFFSLLPEFNLETGLPCSGFLQRPSASCLGTKSGP